MTFDQTKMVSFDEANPVSGKTLLLMFTGECGMDKFFKICRAQSSSLITKESLFRLRLRETEMVLHPDYWMYLTEVGDLKE